jgi:serine-type D-Ala-D-Ala endopeptidase (penicillin-binding protein 7)
MYLSFFINCLATLLFSNLDLKPANALVFYGQCRPALVSRLPENLIRPAIIKKADAPEFNLTASSGVVLLVKNNTFLYEKNATAKQPIASLTKLMTALVFLDHNPGFDNEYTVASSDNIAGGKNNLFTGDTVKISDLLNTSLVASDNGATIALVHSTGLSDKDFVKAMNDKASKLGLFNTSFAEPTGLSDKNVSTARDIARLAKEALSHDEIKNSTTKKEYSFLTKEGREKKISSTDYLLYSDSSSDVNLLGGKTGYTESAGYCFVGKFSDKRQDEIISVVLNSNGKNDRFLETKSLINWVFNNFNWN